MSFTGELLHISDIKVWQSSVLGAIFSALLIPTVLSLIYLIVRFWDQYKPSKLALKNFASKEDKVLIFVSQLSAVKNTKEFESSFERTEPEPFDKYVARIPQKTPKGTVSTWKFYKNIPRVWSECDGECLAEIFNTLGKVGKIENIDVADVDKHLEDWSSSIFSVGFNVKSERIMGKYKPIYFSLVNHGQKGTCIKIKGSEEFFDAIYPNDHAVIQKTTNPSNKKPAVILAGLGFHGTRAAGLYLKSHLSEIGKMYGSKPFCLVLNVKWDEGRHSVNLVRVYPKPSRWNSILHPFVYNLRYKQVQLE